MMLRKYMSNQSNGDDPLGIVDTINAAIFDSIAEAIAKAGGPSLRTPDRCQWQEDGEAWVTQCGHLFQICHGSPEDNGMDFCPYCGRPITTESVDA